MYFYTHNQKNQIKGDIRVKCKAASKHQDITSKGILKILVLCVWMFIFSY